MKEMRKWRGGGRGVGGKGGCCGFFCVVLFFYAAALSAFHLFGVPFRPSLRTIWPSSPAINAVVAVPDDESSRLLSSPPPPLEIRHAVTFPDQVLLVVKNDSLVAPISELNCVFVPSNSAFPNSKPKRYARPISVEAESRFLHVRCPLGPRDSNLSVSSPPSVEPPAIIPYNWDSLAYASIFDPLDNSTVVFTKGLNLRSRHTSDPSRYNCVFGWDLSKPRHLLTAPAISAAQEIIRCKTPLSLLNGGLVTGSDPKEPPLVSVHTKGRRGFLPTVARPEFLASWQRRPKEHSMCVCTMLRNQARFLREWIMYHAHIGVQRWFIYDNNSDDDIEEMLRSIGLSKYNITRYAWPWVKSQEAGFAHCALRARESCKWVGFIDVDEFLYLPSHMRLQDILRKFAARTWIGELRTACHTFGPSNRTTIPPEGAVAGYNCRMNAPERHKSIIRPEALHPSLINVVHHFHLKEGKKYVNIGQGIMVINHYKYQVWEVFKEKFYRRVATYVADWQDEENVGSKDRAPGLGTKAVEPEDWSTRFCEVYDTGLKDLVLRTFADPQTGLLPWHKTSM